MCGSNCWSSGKFFEAAAVVKHGGGRKTAMNHDRPLSQGFTVEQNIVQIFELHSPSSWSPRPVHPPHCVNRPRQRKSKETAAFSGAKHMKKT